MVIPNRTRVRIKYNDEWVEGTIVGSIGAYVGPIYKVQLDAGPVVTVKEDEVEVL